MDILNWADILPKCAYCGNKFESVKSTAKYCSRQCFYKGNYKRESVSCESCNKVFEPARYSKLKGRGRFCSSQCWANINKKLSNRKWLRETYLEDTCKICKFVAEDKCQLDLDHIDGDNSNNKYENFQTLCANCHRLKTHINNDGKWKNYCKSQLI